MNVEAYKANAVKFGRLHGQALAGLSGEAALAATYYDATRVFQQIGEATGEDFSAEEAAAINVYRGYALRHDGALPGYWAFTDGLTEHFLRTGDAKSKEAALLLAHGAMYHISVPPNYPNPEWTKPAALSREVAYGIINFTNAERLGAARHALMPLYFEQALGHIDQWFVSKTAPLMQPFMVGLTSAALIRYHDQIAKDPRIVPALRICAESLWSAAWKGTAFYERSDSPNGPPAPDLNLLIMPLYAFLYRETGEAKYREQAIQIFDGGVNGAWIQGPKQFNQTYLRGWESLKWIEQAPPPDPTAELRATITALKAEAAQDRATIGELRAKIERVREVVK